MSLSGKFARHLETEAVVEIVKTGVAADDKLDLVPVIEFACECGSNHTFTVDEFFTDFEIVEPVDVRVMEIEAPMDAHEFWADIMGVLEAHEAEDGDDEIEGDDDQVMMEVRVH